MFFRKKQKVDLDAKFKEVYHEVNKITADAGNELDVTIKYSQLWWIDWFNSSRS